jgi:phosphatidylglycerol---prolipoprotein diacylglyceryl transferase
MVCTKYPDTAGSVDIVCPPVMITAYPYLSDLVRDLTGISVPLHLPMFGLVVAMALLVSLSVFRQEVQRLHAVGQIVLPSCCTMRNGNVVTKSTFPEEVVGDLLLLAVIAGFVGARIFHILEYPIEFMSNPWGMIFTRSGFTYYGGLIVGILVGVSYLRHRKLAIAPFCDAVAPALILGYAIGRLGCQLSGDGDWGISANMALKPEWIPGWLWAQTYENNILGVVIVPPGVYPTPIYECAMGVGSFVILWGARKHTFQAGWLFSLYLVLTGIERIVIEQIRVNSSTSIFGISVTQAEAISGVSILLGVLGLIRLSQLNGRDEKA